MKQDSRHTFRREREPGKESLLTNPVPSLIPPRNQKLYLFIKGFVTCQASAPVMAKVMYKIPSLCFWYICFFSV
ncbi:hypothetical protein AXX17_AT1G20350 [Arabidopsis thaliana]|uniref:Uncharacterized protein n=1 Tax=Arabidopsis thaliana TaxID=3702 RepID=A0A178WDF3_ARATH|nr:hypothetical protein AXX17_AT1G20350 [Arabidopsis thaliana]